MIRVACPETGQKRALRAGGFWILTASAVLLRAGWLSADQSGTQNNQSSGTTPKSTTTGKSPPAAKITVLRTVGVPVGTKDTTGTTTPKPLTDKPRTRPSPSTPTARNRTTPKATPAAPAKAQASRPVQPQPQAAPAHPPEHHAESPRQATPSTSEGVITVQGSVTSVNLKTTSPMLQLVLSFGPVLTLTADPAHTAVVKGNHIGKLEDVHVHDEVKVAYTPKDGDGLVKSIEVIKEAPPQGSNPSVGASAAGTQKPSD